MGMTHGSESKKSSDMSGLLVVDSGGSAVGDDNDNDHEELTVPSMGLMGTDSRKARGSEAEGVVATFWHKSG